MELLLESNKQLLTVNHFQYQMSLASTLLIEEIIDCQESEEDETCFVRGGDEQPG